MSNNMLGMNVQVKSFILWKDESTLNEFLKENRGKVMDIQFIFNTHSHDPIAYVIYKES